MFYFLLSKIAMKSPGAGPLTRRVGKRTILMWGLGRSVAGERQVQIWGTLAPHKVSAPYCAAL